jgi:hypothetical protein
MGNDRLECLAIDCNMGFMDACQAMRPELPGFGATTELG